MRIYDPRSGRFLSVDPIAREYPWYTPYQFAGNMPIKFVDLDGLEPAAPDQYGTSSERLFFLKSSAVDHGDQNHPANRREVKGKEFTPPRSTAEINVPPNERFEGAMRTNTVNHLKTFVADPEALKEGDPLEWASVVPIGKALKPLAKVVKGAGELVDAGKVVENLSEVVVKETNVYKHSFKYADRVRVRVRGLQDPVSHNFPYSFDDVILSNSPIPKDNGYKIFQQQGTMNGKNGVFEIGLTKDGIIDHRFFKPIK